MIFTMTETPEELVYDRTQSNWGLSVGPNYHSIDGEKVYPNQSSSVLDQLKAPDRGLSPKNAIPQSDEEGD